MFGSKENNNNVQKRPIGQMGGMHNSLVSGTVIDGNVKSETDIRVDGIIRGCLECASKVVIGPEGLLEGKIICANARIEGKFEGEMIVRELLDLRKTAHVTGEITTNKLIIEAGAVFNVTCKMGKGNNAGARPTAKVNKITKEAS